MCIFAGTYMWSIANWSNWLKSTREWWSMGSLPFTARMPPSSYQMFTTSRQQIFDIKHTYSTIHKITDTVTKHIHTHTQTQTTTQRYTRDARARAMHRTNLIEDTVEMIYVYMYVNLCVASRSSFELQFFSCFLSIFLFLPLDICRCVAVHFTYVLHRQ